MHQAKILVADDSCTIRTLVRRALVRHDFDVTVACDGKEAVRCAQINPPDLVILDIQMPEMDGYAACEQILAIEDRPSNLPIIFLTKESARHLNVLGQQFGAYLQKPVSEDILLSTVQALLNIRDSARVCQAVS